MTEELMWKQFNLKARRELEETGVFRQPSEYGEPYAITRALIEEGRSHLMAKKPFDPGRPVIILQGRLDTSVPIGHTRALLGLLAGRLGRIDRDSRRRAPAVATAGLVAAFHQNRRAGNGSLTAPRMKSSTAVPVRGKLAVAFLESEFRHEESGHLRPCRRLPDDVVLPPGRRRSAGQSAEAPSGSRSRCFRPSRRIRAVSTAWADPERQAARARHRERSRRRSIPPTSTPTPTVSTTT